MRFLHTLLLSSALCLLAFIGCTSGADDQPALTKTERLRMQLDPRVGAYIARSEMAYKKGNYNLAFALLDSAEAIVPQLADIYFMRGQLYTRINDLGLSQAAYQRVLALDPEYRGARFNMGLNAFRRGQLRQAVDLYREEEAVNPDPDPILYLEMGKAYAQLGEPDSARMAYEKAIEMKPDYATAYMWMGQLLEELGDLEGALEYSKKGAAIRPGDPDYEYIIGSIYYRKGELEKAIEYLKPVAEKMQWHQGAQYNLGQALMRLGREEEAQFYLARADSAQKMQQQINEAVEGINSDPADRDKWVELAMLQWKSGQRDRAVESYINAVNIDPANFALQSNLAHMMVESGRVEEGIERFQRILRLRPEMVDVWVNLGVAYANLGRHENARAVWEKALSIDPNHERAKAYLAQLDAME